MATNLCEHTLLIRRLTHTTLVLRVLVLHTLALNLSRTAGLRQGIDDRHLQLVQRAGQCQHLRCMRTGSLQIAVAVLHSLVIACNQCCRSLIRHTHVRGDDAILVGRVVHILAQVVQQLDLRAGLGQFCRVFIRHLQCLSSIQLQVNHLVHLFIALQLTLRLTQFLVDLLDTLIDKLLRLQRNLVLVSIRLTVVAVHQCTQEVDTTLGVRILQRNLSDIRLFRGSSHVHGSQVFASHQYGRHNLHNPRSIQAVSLVHHILGEGQRTIGRLARSRQLL